MHSFLMPKYLNNHVYFAVCMFVYIILKHTRNASLFIELLFMGHVFVLMIPSVWTLLKVINCVAKSRKCKELRDKPVVTSKSQIFFVVKSGT